MQKPRSRSPRRARKELNAELERLDVPVCSEKPQDDKAAQDPQAAADVEQAAERIRRMIEAAYT